MNIISSKSINNNQYPILVNDTESYSLTNILKQIGEKTKSQLEGISQGVSKAWDFSEKMMGGAITVSTAAVTVPISLLIGIPYSIFGGACGLISAMTSRESFQQILQEGAKGFALSLVVPALLTITESAEMFYLETGLLKNFSEFTIKIHLDIEKTLTEVEDKVALQLNKTVDNILGKTGLSKLIEKTNLFWDISEKVIGGGASILYATVSVPLFLLIGIPLPFATATYNLITTLSQDSLKKISYHEKLTTALLPTGKGFLQGLTITFEIAILQNIEMFSSATGQLQDFHKKLDDFLFKLQIELE
jgi:hypothetical protein